MRGCSYFAMQVARRLWPEDEFHASLVRFTEEAQRASVMGRKHEVYGRIAALLLRHLDTVEFGIWDYWNEPEKVTTGFQDWVDGLQGKEARQTPAPDGEEQWQVLAMAFLMKRGSNSDEWIQKACEAKEDKLWRRKTFARILKDGITGLNFATVKSDVIYLLPRNPVYGLTDADLKQSGHFSYLRPVED